MRVVMVLPAPKGTIARAFRSIRGGCWGTVLSCQSTLWQYKVVHIFWALQTDYRRKLVVAVGLVYLVLLLTLAACVAVLGVSKVLTLVVFVMVKCLVCCGGFLLSFLRNFPDIRII